MTLSCHINSERFKLTYYRSWCIALKHLIRGDIWYPCERSCSQITASHGTVRYVQYLWPCVQMIRSQETGQPITMRLGGNRSNGAPRLCPNLGWSFNHRPMGGQFTDLVSHDLNGGCKHTSQPALFLHHGRHAPLSTAVSGSCPPLTNYFHISFCYFILLRCSSEQYPGTAAGAVVLCCPGRSPIAHQPTILHGALLRKQSPNHQLHPALGGFWLEGRNENRHEVPLLYMYLSWGATAPYWCVLFMQYHCSMLVCTVYVVPLLYTGVYCLCSTTALYWCVLFMQCHCSILVCTVYEVPLLYTGVYCLCSTTALYWCVLFMMYHSSILVCTVYDVPLLHTGLYCLCNTTTLYWFVLPMQYHCSMLVCTVYVVPQLYTGVYCL